VEHIEHVEQVIRSAIKTSVASSWHFISTYYIFVLTGTKIQFCCLLDYYFRFEKVGSSKIRGLSFLLQRKLALKKNEKNTAPGTERFPAYLYSIKFNASTGLPPSTFFTQQETM